ncbi:MAG: acyloxyacyl hydrolase [Planctomycetaceae bacterium]|nr:acyloxyacyl hydrolase [Planctomycetaceae bacterium]
MPTPRVLHQFVALSVASSFAHLAAHAAEPDAFRLEPTGGDPALIAEIDPVMTDGAAEETKSTDEKPAPRLGDADTSAFEVFGSAASDFDGVTLGIVDAGVAWYVADGVAFGVFGEGIYASLDEDAGDGDSWGGGGGALVRWLFVREATWSMFAEGGCGLVVLSEAVPEQGTTTNFTPRINVGATFALSPTSDLLVRAGWFHLSNAQTGDENDGVDALAVGLGVSWRF